VTSTDDDEMGLAFRIQDSSNYYYAAVDKSAGTKGIYKLVNGTRYTLWEQSATVDLSTWKYIGVQAYEGNLQMYFDQWSPVVTDPGAGGAGVWYAGGVGLEKWYQANARYRYFYVSHG
jgi:hypothetical protein